MKELIEVKVESKVTLSAGRLPEGLTKPLGEALAKAVPLVEEFIKQGLNETKEKE